MKAKTLIRNLFFILLFNFLGTGLWAKEKNVVALSKSLAEMWLLAGGKLSGLTDDALELPECKNAVSVGSTHTASFEAIISLNPDLVLLTQDIPSHKKLHLNLNSLGIQVYVVDVKNFSDYEKVMRDFTSMTGRKDLYQKNVEAVKKDIEKIVLTRRGLSLLESTTRGLSPADTSRGLSPAETYLFLRISGTKNKVLKDHFANEIFQDLGLVPVVNDSLSLDEIGIEAIVTSDPDYIFIVYQGNQKNAEDSFYKAYQSHPAWKDLSAVKNGKVHILPKELFNFKPNERWALAYQTVAGFTGGGL